MDTLAYIMDVNKKEIQMDVYSISSQLPENKDISTKRKWWNINKDMVRFKIHFFLFIGALGTSLPYLSIFAKNKVGLSASSLAAILTTIQFMVIFTKPIIGYLADYFNKLKAIICMLTVLLTIFLFLLLPVPRINHSKTEENNTENYFTLSLHEKNSLRQNETCRLWTRNNTLEKRDFESNVFCSFVSNKEPKIVDECLKIAVPQHKNISKAKESSLILSYEDSYIINSSLCSICCNFTKDCYIVSCPKDSKSSDGTIAEISQFHTYEFWIFAFILTIAMVSINALFTLSDTACCESVVKTGADFGQQRMYGAVGWGTMAPLGGLLHDYTGDYLVSWIVMGVMLAMSLWNIWKIDLVKPQFSQNILKDVGKVLSSVEFLAFEFGVLMNGIGCGIIWSYQIWFLTTIGASRFLCGLVQTVQCFVGEIPFMFFSGWFIKKVGHFNVLTLALAAYCIRFFFYSYLENPWLILPMEVVHGFTYGVFYAAVASYAKLSAKPGTEATTQCILFSTQEGLGAGLGCVIAGLGFDSVGGHQTFFYASIFSGIGMLVNITYTLLNRRQNKSIAVTASTAPQTS